MCIINAMVTSQKELSLKYTVSLESYLRAYVYSIQYDSILYDYIYDYCAYCKYSLEVHVYYL